MNELEPIKPTPISEEIVIPVKTQKIITPTRPLRRGMTQWEFDLQTKVGKPVEFKSSEISKGVTGMVQIKHHIEYRNDRYYCQAINLTNATRKFKKWLIMNRNARVLMLSRQPKPESPSAAACE